MFQPLAKSRLSLHLEQLQRSNLQMLQSSLADTAASTGPVPSDLSSGASTDPGHKQTANSKTVQTSLPPLFWTL